MARRKRVSATGRHTTISSKAAANSRISGKRTGANSSRDSAINMPAIALTLVLIVIAAVPFFYGKYLEFNTNGAFDGGLNVYTAQAIVHGQKINRNIFPSARPDTLLVNVIGVAVFGFSELGPKLIQMFMQLIALGLMFYTLRKLYGLMAAGLALIMLAFFISCPPFAKFGNVKEQFMIACMLIAACSVILNHMGYNKRWLLLAGAAAVNAWYFKPTGISITIAIGIYMIYASLKHIRTWKQFWYDINQLFIGAGIGLIPLTIFYTWQNQLPHFLKGFPAIIIFAVLIVLAIHKLLRMLKYYAQHHQLRQQLSNVKPVIWLSGLIAIVLSLIICTVIFARKDQGIFYLKDIIFIKYTIQAGILILAQLNRAIAFIHSPSQYVTGSRSVSNFSSQFNLVFSYYRSLIVPIGLAATALILRIRYAISTKHKKITNNTNNNSVANNSNVNSKSKTNNNPIVTDTNTHSHTNINSNINNTDNFAILFALWWVLDMLFVWVSPRSYVEYFLPLNASAAMLAAWLFHCCQKNSLTFIWILTGWLITQFLLVWLSPSAHFPYITLQSTATVTSFWGWYTVRTIPLIFAIAIYALIKRYPLQKLCNALLALTCIIMAIWWSNSNIKIFADRVSQTSKMKAAGFVPTWEQIAHYIRDNSTPQDGLYVWGWYPGIYVQAQRYCPARHPAESDMHTDPPAVLKVKIQQLLQDLKKNPPLYIVDSQKDHFPYHAHPFFPSHPRFDLWPQVRGNKRISFVLRPDMSGDKRPARFISLANMKRFQPALMNQVEQYTYSVLTFPKRPGGPFPKQKARKLAQTEKQRHEIMTPLRMFVMEHYEPVNINAQPMFLFRRKQ